MQALLLTAIRLYKLCLSPFLSPACRFTPTCSEYAAEVIQRFGAAKGGWLAIKRLARCHPFGPAGVDLAPERLPDRKSTPNTP